MRILGIDPGSRVTGWGLVESSGWDLKLAGHGALRLATAGDLSARLVRLATELRQVIQIARADVAAVEQVFSAKNANSALILGQARGVILLVLAEAHLPLSEYTPTQVKSGVCGFGGADKQQIQAALAAQFAMRELPKPLDASDALAVAVCHASAARFQSRLAVVQAGKGARA